VFLRIASRNGRTIAAAADRGTFLATDDPDVILFRLTNGRLVNNQPDYRAPRVLSFQQHDLPINMPAVENFRGRGDGTKELTIFELWRLGGDTSLPQARRNAIRANFHFRMVEVAMMLLVPLLALSLAVPPKRSTSGLGIFIAIIFVVVYHKVNQYAEQMGALSRFDPVIALWTPFLIFGGSIVWMYYTLAHKPGGQPIGALERIFARISKLVGRLLRRPRKPALAAS
jgi:lipopolysaccharide export system permease protein